MIDQPVRSIFSNNSAKNLRLFAMLFALVGGIAILFAKFYAANVSNSTALRSDALEGTANVLAAIFGTISLLIAEKPADHDHPYGHGKIEYFSAAFEGGLITLAAVLILIDASSRIFSPEPFGKLDLGLQLNAIAGLGNGIIGGLIYWIGTKTRSEILRADGLHLLTDLVTTVGMIIGLLVAKFTGLDWIDPALAILLSLFLLKTGYRLVMNSASALLDAQSPTLLQKIVNSINLTLEDPKFNSIIAVHDLKAQQFGRDHHIDVHLVVPEFISIKTAHDLADEFAATTQMKLEKNGLGHDNAIHTHIDPCEKHYCTQCLEKDCPIRTQPFQFKPPLTVDSAIQSENV